MHRTVKRWLVACGAAAIVVGTVAGLALATGGDGGRIAACAKTATGQLRIDQGDGCLPSEQALQLGTAAASRADERYYVAPNLADSTTFLPLGTGRANATKVVTMHVPAGDYALAAQITMQNHDGDGTVVCLILDADSGTHGFDEAAVGRDAGFQNNETITIDGALSLPADTDLSLSCWNNGGGMPLVLAADITTKSVDSASITQEVH